MDKNRLLKLAGINENIGDTASMQHTLNSFKTEMVNFIKKMKAQHVDETAVFLTIEEAIAEAGGLEGYEERQPETFSTDDGREEPSSGRMSTDDDDYGVGGLIDQGR